MTFRTLVILAGLVSVPNLAHATEQKIVFVVESIKYAKDTGSERCQNACSYKNTKPDLESLMNDSWKIVTSTSKEIIARDYESWRSAGIGSSYGCTCIGIQYVLQRD